jgi:hypothetical protein
MVGSARIQPIFTLPEKVCNRAEKSVPGFHAQPSATKGPEAAQSILHGYGTGGFTIKTNSPEAQEYFNNGMQLAHAFAHKSAIAAFRRAEQLDPACAMCVWGEAWARGPSINFTIDDDAQAELVPLVAKAAVLARNNPERERELIAALEKRYKNGEARARVIRNMLGRWTHSLLVTLWTMKLRS